MKFKIIGLLSLFFTYNAFSQQKEITFSSTPAWNFSVNIRAAIPIEPSTYKQPDKMLVLSDIEGEFTVFRRMMIANKVMDENYRWTFGKGHLVICGDLFDRGNEVEEYLWLLYKLEQDAKASGGYVHTLLGNHDIMNLSGDLRYVQPRYLAEAKAAGIDYMSLYTKDTDLGKWLRSKNIIEKIGDNLCMHAGISPEIMTMKMPVEEINRQCRPFYDRSKQVAEINPQVAKFFSGKTSPFWYRGYFIEPKAPEAVVEETCRFYQVQRIIVGHTITDTNVGFYYGGRVLGVNVDHHNGNHQAALFENGKWYKVDQTGIKREM